MNPPSSLSCSQTAREHFLMEQANLLLRKSRVKRKQCFAVKTESLPARSPVLPQVCKIILASSLCLGARDWKMLCWDEGSVHWDDLLSFACLLSSGCVMWAVWKYLEPSAVTEGSDCKYWGYMCQPDFQPVLYLMSPLIKAWIILPPKSHVKHKNLWERAFISLHIQYQICQFSVQISGQCDYCNIWHLQWICRQSYCESRKKMLVV